MWFDCGRDGWGRTGRGTGPVVEACGRAPRHGFRLYKETHDVQGRYRYWAVLLRFHMLAARSPQGFFLSAWDATKAGISGQVTP